MECHGELVMKIENFSAAEAILAMETGRLTDEFDFSSINYSMNVYLIGTSAIQFFFFFFVSK